MEAQHAARRHALPLVNSLATDIHIRLESRSVFLSSLFFFDVAPLGRLHQIFVRGVRRAAMQEAIADHDREGTD